MHRVVARAWLVGPMVWLAAGCGSRDSGDAAPDASTAPAPLAPATQGASKAASIVRSLRDLRVRPGKSDAPAPPQLDAPADAPVLQPSAVTRFDKAPNGLRAIVPASNVGRPAVVSLPLTAAGAFRVDAGAGRLVDVTLHGASDAAAETVDGYAVYPRARGEGTSLLHRVTAEGTEDWVAFDTRPADESLAYDVRLGTGVAGVRFVADTVEFLDADGTPQLRMAPPYVVTDGGERIAARVSVSGCELDRDPAPPWGRAVVAPKSDACRVEVRWSDARYPLVVDPAWTTTGSLITPRYNQTASLLSTGRVLVAGGYNGSTLASCELFDPTTRTFASTGTMLTARRWHSANLLGSTSVLVAGGYGASSYALNNAERYNVSAGTWTSAGILAAARYQQGSATLADGRVLVAGGYGSSYLQSAEIYNPSTNTWTTTASMASPRWSPVVVALPSGEVLAATGYNNGSYITTAERWVPSTGTWVAAGALGFGRYYGVGALLPSGKVLVYGGYGSAGALSNATLYDPTTNSWSTTGSMTSARYNHDGALLSGGRVLAMGGQTSTTSAEIYDSSLGSWSVTNALNYGRYSPTATAIGTSSVVVIGGYGASYVGPAEVYSGSQPCTDGSTCASGYCADSYCCDTPCSGGCDRCNVPGWEGTCRVVSLGTAGQSPSCFPYACDGTNPGCPATCTSNATCDSAYQCAGGACVPKLSTGSACTLSGQCVSGYCVDGFCCNTSCAGGCNVCASALGALADGTCTNVTGAGSPSCSPYVCSGSSGACPTSCSSAAGCVSGYYCAPGGFCAAKQANGTSCSTATQCQSNLCVDGFCCNDACTGGCDRCDVAGFAGTCRPIGAGNGGFAPSCAPYVCDGSSSACPTSCTSNANCASTSWCSSGACVAKGASGASCTAGIQCLTGFCADGVCCNTTCSGACDACSVSAGALTDGVCRNIVGPGSPSCAPFACSGATSACPTACSGDSSCAAGKFCFGGNCIDRYALGAVCAANNECTSGFCVDGVCCNSACSGACDRCSTAAGAPASGTCSPVSGPGSPSCFPFVCDGVSGGCPTACSSDATCAAGWFCGSGTCAPKKANGGTCSAGSQCVSGNCADGVCCNTACNAGACDRCDVYGWVGTCTNAPLGDPGSPSCAPYACSGTSGACPTSCTSDATCAVGMFCSSGACVAKLADGAACTGASQCQSDKCTDGVCCNSLCLGPCDRCDREGSKGTCGPVSAGTTGTPSCGLYTCDGASNACPSTCTTDANCTAGAFCKEGVCVPTMANGAACVKASHCASGFCVDGYCCGNACDAQCARCDAPGSLGSCVATSGEPVGSRPKCSGGGTACGGRCDGVNVLSCAFPGASTTCGATSCKDGVETQPSTCDGAGACTPKETRCSPYRCGESKCLTACRDNADCTDGAVCLMDKCVAPTDAGADGGADDASADGAIIDDAGGREVPVEEGSGCGCRTPASGGDSGIAALATLALSVVVTRRRRASQSRR